MFYCILVCDCSIFLYLAAGMLISATGMQLPGVIDELFSYTGPLGAVFSDEAITFYLWAPTAQVKFLLAFCTYSPFLCIHQYSSVAYKYSFCSSMHSVYLMSITKQSVHVLIYGDAAGEDPLEIVQLKETNGVWTAYGPRSWEGYYYVYEVSVYHPSTLRIERCFANDPYARG